MSESLIQAEESGQEDTADAEHQEGQTQENTAQDAETHSPEFEDERKGELYAGKYKSVDDLEKGYKEAVQKLTEKQPQAPEEYNFDFTDDEDLKEFSHLEPNLALNDDPLVQEIAPVLKKHNISQEAASDIAKAYLKTELSSAGDPGEEMKKLGDQGQEIIKEVNTFVGKNFSQEEQQVAEQIGQSAEGVKFLHKLSQMAREKNIPTDATGESFESAGDFIEKAGDLKKKHGGNLYGEAAREYEKLMDKAAQISMKS